MKSWTLQAKNTYDEWVTLDTQTNNSVITDDTYTAFGFALNNSTAYKDYRFTNIATRGRDSWISGWD